MRLSKKFDYALILVAIISLGLLFASIISRQTENTFADGVTAVSETSEHHLIIYDQGEKISIKTTARTVAEALNRANITLGDYDTTDPALETEIDADNFYINIYRARPVIVKVGTIEKYLMTTSYDPKAIAKSAGITVYDGDEINLIANTNFLEAGAANVYEVVHKGGATVTIEEEIPFANETITDFDLALGTQEVRQLGEVGRKKVIYTIKSVDGVEVGREKISETIVQEPVKRITALGAHVTVSTTPTENEAIAWNYLLSQGFTPVQAAGIMGNLQQEHHFETTDTAGGLGIAQWTAGRRENLLAKSDPYNIYTQLNYLMEELNGGYSAVKSSLSSAATIEEAVQIFQNQFERCGICRESQRIEYAYEIYGRYAR